MEILVGILAAWGLIMLLWTLAGVLLLPLERQGDSEMTVMLRCRGQAAWLERQVRGLLWLRESGLLWWDILVLDMDMDAEALDRAKRLEKDHKPVVLMDYNAWKEWMEAGNEPK